MTVTEAPRDVLDAAAVDTEPVSPTGLAALVGSGDPRSIGKLYVGTSLLFLLVAGVTGVLVGFEQYDISKPDNILATDVLASIAAREAVSWKVIERGTIVRRAALLGDSPLAQRLRFLLEMPIANLFDFLL